MSGAAGLQLRGGASWVERRERPDWQPRLLRGEEAHHRSRVRELVGAAKVGEHALQQRAAVNEDGRGQDVCVRERGCERDGRGQYVYVCVCV